MKRVRTRYGARPIKRLRLRCAGGPRRQARTRYKGKLLTRDINLYIARPVEGYPFQAKTLWGRHLPNRRPANISE